MRVFVVPLFIDPGFVDPLFVDPLFVDPLFVAEFEAECGRTGGGAIQGHGRRQIASQRHSRRDTRLGGECGGQGSPDAARQIGRAVRAREGVGKELVQFRRRCERDARGDSGGGRRATWFARGGDDRRGVRYMPA